MCRKGFRLLDPDVNKEQFRCVLDVHPHLNKGQLSGSTIAHPSASPPIFKVQALQGRLQSIERLFH